MKKMFALVSLVFAFAAAVPARANLEIAAVAQAVQTTYEASGGGSVDNVSGTKLGALVLFPIFPGVSIRTGAIMGQRKAKVSSILGDIEYTDTLMDIPVNVQIGLPITSMYVFGGLVLSNTQSTDCTSSIAGASCTSSKTPSDNLVNVGIGGDLFSLAVVRISLEAEYQKGMKDLDDSSSGELKQSNLGVGLVAAFGF